MRTAVYDTYVLKKDSSTMHFDIIVPEEKHDFETIAGFGREFIATKGEAGQPLSQHECQYCHIETPSDAVINAINDKGYYILEFDDIPAALPPDPTRTQLIQHIRAKSAELRFSDFRGKPEEELKMIVSQLDKK
jgi:hypothetical protein